MRIVFIGTGEIGVPTLKALLKSEHEVVGVVTQPDKPAGREQQIEPPPVKKALLSGASAVAPNHFRSSNRRESKIELRLERSVRSSLT